jgi:hypothetical protein
MVPGDVEECLALIGTAMNQGAADSARRTMEFHFSCTGLQGSRRYYPVPG